MIKSICVYCGSATGHASCHAQSARQLAQILAQRGIELVYGGGKVGLMGILADEMLRCGGKVIGVIPRDLVEKEVGHDGLTRLYVVQDMHQRKALMSNLADAFIALSGGIGTLEELMEALTWSQLGYHHKPIGILNTEGFYDPLLKLLAHFSDEGFLKRHHADLMLHASEAEPLVDKLLAFPPKS